jgi:hypothetical protein
VGVSALAGCAGENNIVVPKQRGGVTTTTEAPGDDPCKLLKVDDVAKVFGATFAPGSPAGVVAQCEFRTRSALDDPAEPAVTLHIQGEVTIASFETGKLTAPGGGRDVVGIGDQAYYAASEGRLFVRKGVFGFDVSATPSLVPGPEGVQRLIALAQLVIDRHK